MGNFCFLGKKQGIMTNDGKKGFQKKGQKKAKTVERHLKMAVAQDARGEKTRELVGPPRE